MNVFPAHRICPIQAVSLPFPSLPRSTVESNQFNKTFPRTDCAPGPALGTGDRDTGQTLPTELAAQVADRWGGGSTCQAHCASTLKNPSLGECEQPPSCPLCARRSHPSPISLSSLPGSNVPTLRVGPITMVQVPFPVI